VHEIFIDLNDSSDTSKICDELFVREKDYLDPSKISKMQVSYSAPSSGCIYSFKLAMRERTNKHV
jgi:hypothetical protein